MQNIVLIKMSFQIVKNNKNKINNKNKLNNKNKITIIIY